MGLRDPLALRKDPQPSASPEEAAAVPDAMGTRLMAEQGQRKGQLGQVCDWVGQQGPEVTPRSSAATGSSTEPEL